MNDGPLGNARADEIEASGFTRKNRLQITADVDLEGIATLKEMLGDYESILRRLTGKQPK